MPRSRAGFVYGRQVHVVDRNRTALGQREAEQQIEGGALTRSARANQGRDFAGLGNEAERIERRAAFGMRERHALETNAMRLRRLQRRPRSATLR